MHGYAATARIDRARPRFAPPRTIDAFALRAAAAPIVDVPDLADTRVRDDLVDRLEALGERWSQLTFYLFDSESWR